MGEMGEVGGEVTEGGERGGGERGKNRGTGEE